MKTLKHNALLCLDCSRVLASFWGHHFVRCDCDNRAFADGGFNYFRYGAKDLTRVKRLYLLSVTERAKVKRKVKKKGKKK